tara:strand:+ start:735 stop:1154 length:420 start_codon:yes stop_codon:yes gene_type:complete
MDSVYMIYLNVLFNVYLIAISIIVQFIVYPSFKNILESFTEYHNRYTTQMFWIVGPVMILEISTSIFLLLKEFERNLVPGLIVLVIWLLTFVYIVPLHKKLSKQFTIHKHIKLLKLNFIRTILWVLKFLVLITIIMLSR